MAWKRSVLVVANKTASSDELRRELRSRAAGAPTVFTLLLVAGRGQDAEQLLSARLGELRQEGLEVEGCVGESDPLFAVLAVWDPAEYDEILLSTLPVGSSRWLRADLPRRVERLTGALVTHVVAGGSRAASRVNGPPAHRAVRRTGPEPRSPRVGARV